MVAHVDGNTFSTDLSGHLVQSSIKTKTKAVVLMNIETGGWFPFNHCKSYPHGYYLHLILISLGVTDIKVEISPLLSRGLE